MAIEDIFLKLALPSLLFGAIFGAALAFISARWISRRPYVIILFGIFGFIFGASIGAMPFLASLFS